MLIVTVLASSTSFVHVSIVCVLIYSDCSYYALIMLLPLHMGMELRKQFWLQCTHCFALMLIALALV